MRGSPRVVLLLATALVAAAPLSLAAALRAAGFKRTGRHALSSARLPEHLVPAQFQGRNSLASESSMDAQHYIGVV